MVGLDNMGELKKIISDYHINPKLAEFFAWMTMIGANPTDEFSIAARAQIEGIILVPEGLRFVHNLTPKEFIEEINNVIYENQVTQSHKDHIFRLKILLAGFNFFNNIFGKVIL